MIDRIKWLGHGSFLIQGPPIIFIDPWRVVRAAFHADVILISHTHYDHCSPADINKLRGPDTIIIGNEHVASQIDKTTVLRPWQSLTIDRLSIKAIPAYHPDGSQHPKEAGGLGFVLSLNFYDIYYAGDTGLIPEMERLHPDIAMLPIDNNGTMSVETAAEAVQILQPDIVFPANWGDNTEGASTVDARLFKERVTQANSQTRVILPEKEM